MPACSICRIENLAVRTHEGKTVCGRADCQLKVVREARAIVRGFRLRANAPDTERNR